MNKELPPEVEKRIEEAAEQFGQALRELYRWSQEGEEGQEPPTIAEIEEKIRAWIQRIGEDGQGLIVGEMEWHRRKGKSCCPRCGEAVYWQRYEPKDYVTTLGRLKIERAYYYHAACHCGWVPLDEQLALGRGALSPLVQEMVSYLGAYMPFEQTQDYLRRYLGIRISHDTVNNTTVGIGQELRAEQEQAIAAAWSQEQGPPQAVAEPPPEEYISADGIKHLLPDGQGKELKVAAIYQTEKVRGEKDEVEVHAVDIAYVVAREGEELAQAAYLVAAQRGVEQAQQRIVLGDGANWIWNQVAPMFHLPDCVEIVDFYHASEYLWRAGEAMFGAASPPTQAWAEEACHALKHEGPMPVLTRLRALATQRATVPEPVSDALRYFENQSPRMNYPLYRQKELQIGSGSAESAVKQVVGVRLNQAGMRWNSDHAESVAHVRAAILSRRWSSFWSGFQPTARHYQRKQLSSA